MEPNKLFSILLLEDDPVLAREVADFISSKRAACTIAYDGEMFLKFHGRELYDVILLDINVPKINGLEICKLVRQTDHSTPILMTTAFGEIEDKAEAFETGVDDYLVKPFHLEELWLRINALMRRKDMPQKKENTIEIDDLVIYSDKKSVFRNGTEIVLTPKEFKLLCILAENRGIVLSKQRIAELLWDYHIETTQNTIEVYINFLRNKIDKHCTHKLIHTKIGFGYYIGEI